MFEHEQSGMDSLWSEEGASKALCLLLYVSGSKSGSGSGYTQIRCGCVHPYWSP